MEHDGNNEEIVLQNITKRQYVEEILAPLSEQMVSVYKIEDCVFYAQDQPTTTEAVGTDLYTLNNVVKIDNELKDYTTTDTCACRECSQLLNQTNNVTSASHEFETKHEYILSQELKCYQKQLITRQESRQEQSYYSSLYFSLYANIHSENVPINSEEYCSMLDDIDKALTYLNNHQNFKEFYIYRIKYENLLATALHNVLQLVNEVIIVATIQDVNLALYLESGNIDLAFSFYYEKFLNAANEVSIIISHIEEKIDESDIYKRTLIDCQKAYFSQRWIAMSITVLNILTDLTKHANDLITLYRLSAVLVKQVCNNEVGCYHYFFHELSPQIEEYLGSLCQHLYDTLQPRFTSIDQLAVVIDLCYFLKNMVHYEIQYNSSNDLPVALDQFVDTVKQLIQDVEERLVFCAKVFVQYGLLKYEPSPDDLAYPEKLEEMENIAEEISETRSDSGASAVSVDLQEAANLNTEYLDSPTYTLGMWYPTVRKTLSYIFHLYFCLDKEIFQGLAEEALIICMETIASASNKIIFIKSFIDGKLFQIKHLLIINEQIYSYLVDFAAKESVGLLQKIYSNNNRLLLFLLEGSPKIKEYPTDARKEIDKQLKASCEEFISHTSSILIGNDLLEWIHKKCNSETILVHHILEVIDGAQGRHVTLILKEQDFARSQNIATIITQVKRHLKLKIPDIQRSMKLYLADKETEFILFRQIKNNILNTFIQLENILAFDEYTDEDRLMIDCPTTDQLNIFISSIFLTGDQ